MVADGENVNVELGTDMVNAEDVMVESVTAVNQMSSSPAMGVPLKFKPIELATGSGVAPAS